MSTKLVDGRGRPISIRRVMLHHVVFVNRGRPGGPRKASSCKGRGGEPFYGTGEETQRLILPRGYGYKIDRREHWSTIAMYMSHTAHAQDVYLQYTVTIETSRRLEPVRPLWLRANGCDPSSSYTVPGGGAPGSTDVRPMLHEPGPIATGYFLSRTGIPVRKGELLRVTGRYDGQLPHPFVMAITHIYVARDQRAPRGCGPLPADRRTYWTRTDGRRTVAPGQVPLTSLDAHGRPIEVSHAVGPQVIAGDSATVDLVHSLFKPPNLSIARGGRVTWYFRDNDAHNVQLANGPRAVASPTQRRGGVYTQTFAVPGTYNLFCYLHPVTMHQTLTVRP